MSSHKPAPTNIRVFNAALGNDRIQGRMYRVIRGMIGPESFGSIIVPKYQREAMRHHKHGELVEVMDPINGIGVPDDLIMCCRTDTIKSAGSGTLIITDAILYVLDGHQRMTANWTRQGLQLPVAPIGIKIILGTTEEMERDTFYQINRLQTRVESNVHLSNSDNTPAINALKQMINENPTLIGVQWGQLRASGQDITAHMLYELTVILHGKSRPHTIEQILERLDVISDEYGTGQMAANMKAFFQIIEKCFGDTDKRQYMYRIDLLRAMARLFAEHADFWDRRRADQLTVRTTDIKKLGQTKRRDVETGLRQSNGAGDLFTTILRQINRQRDTHLEQKK